MRTTRTIETLIERERGLVFDTLADLRHYDAWLPHSVVFKGTASISEGPIRPGTTYIETSIWGTRNGTITEMDRPARVSYRQPMTLRPAWLGVIDVRVVDILEEAGSSTRLKRSLSLGFQGPVRFFRNAVARSFVIEIERMQARLKACLETMPQAAGDAQ